MNEYKHCCNLMSEFLDEKKVTIGYSKRLKSYYINVRMYQFKIDKLTCQKIYYCPWCGIKLPKPLDDEYDLELSKALNVDVDDITYDTYFNTKLPPEFLTDEWWKKRGL